MKVNIEVVNDVPILRIECPLNMAKTSRSGNSTILATTRGQQFVGKIGGGDVYVQLNVMKMETTGGLEITGTTTASVAPAVTSEVGNRKKAA